MIDRDAVRSNAQYLRNVRPVDPEEICEYVEGHPHPAAVRQVLREEAFDIGMVEREDGTFVPVSEEPVSPPNWEPDALPEEHVRALADLLVERFGVDWAEGKSGDRLREAVRRLKADYYHQNPVEYDETAALGYAIYHLPDFYATVGYVLDDLTERGLLPRRLRVLDVGAGVGGPALGIEAYLPDDALVEYHALEPSAAADVFERLVGDGRRNVNVAVHRERVETFEPEGEFDLILCANVLSELDDPVAVVQSLLDSLSPRGSLVGIAPADLNTSTGLRAVERAVVGPETGVDVYSPTLRLWPGEAPTDRGWSFDVRQSLSVPSVQRRLDDAGDDDPGTFVNTSVQFSYVVLRTDGERRAPIRASASRHAKMAEVERYVTDRVDLLAVKLSHDLSDGDANPVFKVGDGSEAEGHFAVLTRPSALNAALERADYGDVLSFENVLVLWNDDERAYNLVVDDETVVDRLA
jgi:SAM-dependent methyltransferase